MIDRLGKVEPNANQVEQSMPNPLGISQTIFTIVWQPIFYILLDKPFLHQNSLGQPGGGDKGFTLTHASF